MFLVFKSSVCGTCNLWISCQVWTGKPQQEPCVNEQETFILTATDWSIQELIQLRFN